MGVGGAMMLLSLALKAVQLYQFYHRTFTQIPTMIVDEADIVTYTTNSEGKKVKNITFDQFVYYEVVNCNRQQIGIHTNAQGGVSDYAGWGCGDAADINAYVGKQFTDLEEADTDGNMHKLSEYVGKGKWVLVDFWASWCGPCMQEMPNVVAAYEKYHAKGFDVVGLSFDNKKEPWLKAIADQKMPWTHLSDLKGWRTVASSVYDVNSIPDNLLIDPQGKIVARGLRAQALQDKLKQIFGE